jgi:hypothetical protein
MEKPNMVDNIARGLTGAIAAAVTQVVLENPLAMAAIAVVAVGFGIYKAAEAVVDAASPIIEGAADYVSEAYESATTAAAAWFNEPAEALPTNVRQIPVRAAD